MTEARKCSHCGGTQFLPAMAGGQVHALSQDGMHMIYPVSSGVCLNCGVVLSYIDQECLTTLRTMHAKISAEAQVPPATACCVTCGKPVDINQSITVRLNNHGLPNGPGDQWGHKHRECATPDELAELDGSKYFGVGWNSKAASIPDSGGRPAEQRK
jgi:hypothetical protein